MLSRAQSVQPLTDFLVRVVFTDGTTRDLDLASYLQGPIFIDDFTRTVKKWNYDNSWQYNDQPWDAYAGPVYGRGNFLVMLNHARGTIILHYEHQGTIALPYAKQVSKEDWLGQIADRRDFGRRRKGPSASPSPTRSGPGCGERNPRRFAHPGRCGRRCLCRLCSEGRAPPGANG